MKPSSAIDRKAVIDEFGQLEARIPWEQVRRHELLAKKIRSWYEDSDPEQGFSAEGSLFRIHVGPRGNQTRVRSMLLLFGHLGKAVFLRHCSFALKALNELVTPSEIDDLTVTERTGPRKLDVFSLERERVA